MAGPREDFGPGRGCATSGSRGEPAEALEGASHGLTGVVLDEPNSNLDAEGDEALTRAILGARARGAIVIVIAHRPSALLGVDLILAMAQGRVQAFGPKEEVLQKVLERSKSHLRSVKLAAENEA